MLKKLMTMHGGFSMNSNVDNLYVSRKNGGRGQISVMSRETCHFMYTVHHSADPYIKLMATIHQIFRSMARSTSN